MGAVMPPSSSDFNAVLKTAQPRALLVPSSKTETLCSFSCNWIVIKMKLVHHCQFQNYCGCVDTSFANFFASSSETRRLATSTERKSRFRVLLPPSPSSKARSSPWSTCSKAAKVLEASSISSSSSATSGCSVASSRCGGWRRRSWSTCRESWPPSGRAEVNFCG